MQHFVYAVSYGSPAPAGIGDAASWLRYYKLDNDDEVFIPMAEGLEEIQAGDTLWFIIEGILYGAVPVLRIEEDAINERKEVWFDGSCIQHAEPGVEIANARTAKISTMEAVRWTEVLEGL